MNTNNKSKVKYGNKYFTVQSPEGREAYIEVSEGGIRRKVTLGTLNKLKELETVEGWERLSKISYDKRNRKR